MNSKNSNIYFFDFCGTVYQSNTTLDFLAYLIGKVSWSVSARIIINWVMAKILKDLNLISENDYLKMRIKSLKGLQKDKINNFSKKFLNELELNNKLNEKVLGKINEVETKGGRIILISFTIQNLLDQFLASKKIKGEAYGSVLEFNKKGAATGHYSVFLPKKGKLEFLLKSISLKDIRKSFFMTDDKIADQDLIQEVKESKVL